jgi:CBS domain containing-hemolysin-like protein
MSTVSLIVLIVLAWVLAAFALGLAFALIAWRRRRPQSLAAQRRDRRAADRRIGLPDPREVRIERRSGHDRRRGPAAMA